eukprot:7028216-Pyramimonas_sp.AAC.1
MKKGAEEGRGGRGERRGGGGGGGNQRCKKMASPQCTSTPMMMIASAPSVSALPSASPPSSMPLAPRTP